MIRKAVVVVLTFASGAAAALCAAGNVTYHESALPAENLKMIRVMSGRLFVSYVRDVDPNFLNNPVASRTSHFLGFLYMSGRAGAHRPSNPPQVATLVAVPLWMSLVITTPYPTTAFIRGPLRRWRRRKRGECANCGYNLTGNVTGVCSECGTKIESR